MRKDLALLIVLGTAVCAALTPPGVSAQDTPAQAAEALRVFLDCDACQSDFVRREIPWVSYMRDRQDADMHVLVTAQNTGGGGRQFLMNFIGNRELAGEADTLVFNSPPNATDDFVRRGLARLLKIGLAPYALGTPQAEGIDITFREPRAEGGAPAVVVARDPWKFWTFRIGLNGNAGGESSRSNWSTSGNFNASRTTAQWKSAFNVDGRYNESHITYVRDSVETTSITINRNWGVNGRVVKTITGPISAGIGASVTSSVFTNYDLAVRIAPAIEYSVFPYTESSRRQLLFQYSLGAQYSDYAEETVYFQTEETLLNQSIAVEYRYNQPWGNGRVEVERSNYLHDWDLNRLRFDGNIEVNLFRGLTFNTGGNYSSIHDQISLRRRSPSDEDVLLARRQLETNYDFDIRFGLGYRFGSIFNNVVNPRMNTSGLPGQQTGGGGGSD
jgi:hypothetical protein